MTSGIFWNLEIGNLEFGNSRKLASFSQFQYVAYFSHSVYITEFDFELRISNFQFFWNLEIGHLEIWKFLEIDYFGPISIYWVFFPLSLGYRTWFWTQNFKFSIFLDFFRKYSGNLEIFRNLLFSPISMYGASFPLDFSHWNWFCTQNIKFQNFSGFFWGNFLKIWKFSRVCYIKPIHSMLSAI